MKTEYLVVELCQERLNGIDEKTFRRNKKHYIAFLEETDNVSFGKRGRFSTIILEQKEKAAVENEDEFLNILGCDIGGKSIDLMKFILKALLEKKIVPVQEELAYWAKQAKLVQSDSRGTIKNYLAFLKEHDIILDPMKVPVWIENPVVTNDGKEIFIKRQYDKETGEILPTYYKKYVNHIYFEYEKDGKKGNREMLSNATQEAIKMAYQNIMPEAMMKEIYPLYGKHDPKFIEKERQKLKRKIILKIGKAYRINNCVRIDEPIINPTIKRQLKEYFGL